MQKSILEIKLYLKKETQRGKKISKPKSLLVCDILVPNLESEVKKALYKRRGKCSKLPLAMIERHLIYSLAWPAQRQKMFQLLLFCLV